MISFARKIASSATNIIEKAWIYTHPKTDISSTVLLVGAPRSGTTWIMEILEKIGNYRVIFEPFHPEFYPVSRKFISRFLNEPVYRPYLPVNYEDEGLKKYLNMIFQGKVSGYWYSPPQRLISNLKWLKTRKVLVKDVWITRLLPWIAHKFRHEIKNFFLLIRHPCAVIESQIRTCIGNPLCYYSKNVVKKTILRQLDTIEELKDIIDYIRPRLESINRSEEILAAIWSIDYYVPLYYSYYHGKAFNIITYEEFILHFIKTIRRLIHYLKLKVPEDNVTLSKLFARRSPTAQDTIKRTLNNIHKWRNKLLKQQIESILKVTHSFNLTFYDKSIEPNLNELREWKP